MSTKRIEREIKKKTGAAKQGAKQKSGRAMAHPAPPLESPLVAGVRTAFPWQAKCKNPS